MAKDVASFVIQFARKIGGVFHKGADYVVEFSREVFDAFLPILKAESGEFVRDFKDFAEKTAILAAQQFTTNGDKIKFFAKEIAKEAKNRGIPFVKEHLVNLLREVTVSLLKAKGLL